MSLSMKIFRWILSHLTLIIVLTLILYFYWNRNEYFSDRVPDSSQVADNESKAMEQGVDHAMLPSVPEQRDNDKTQVVIKKSIEKHAIIEKGQQESTLYPSDVGIAATVAKQVTPPENTSPDVDTQLASSELVYSEKIESDRSSLPEGFSERKRKYEQRLAVQSGDTEKYSDEAPQQPQVQVSMSQSSKREVNSKTVPAQVNPVGFHDETLQEQIRARQKKLSHQMVSLISLTIEHSEAVVEPPEVDIEPIKPVIETAEQRQMVLLARQAFEQRNFKLAEEKYLQLMNQLPELPDVVGELANVYKTQNRQSDYISMNTKFVKRLVDHYRFEEAWRVMTETAKFDKESANKQRRIINKKQQQLEL